MYAAADWTNAERGLKQVTASVDITLDGVGSASGFSSSRAVTRSSLRVNASVPSPSLRDALWQVQLLKAAREMFRTADKAFSGGKSEGNEEDFCRSAFSQVNSSAVHLVTVEAQAAASSISCGRVRGNALVA